MSSNRGICQLCRQEKKLIKSHVIPKCFHKNMKADTNSYFLVHLNPLSSQTIGDCLFDKNILCASCDNSFSSDEKYTSIFFESLRSSKNQKEIESSQVDAISVKADIYHIKNCLLSILWRMSISKRLTNGLVHLKEKESILAQRLNDPKILDPTFFPFTIYSLRNAEFDPRSQFLCGTAHVSSFKNHDIYLLHIPDFFIFFHANETLNQHILPASYIDDQNISIIEAPTNEILYFLNMIYKDLSNII